MSSPLFPYDWQLSKDVVTEKQIIHCWCKNKDSESCLVRIENFETFFHLELPETVSWSQQKVDYLLEYIYFRTKEKAPTKSQFVEKLNLYYFKNNKKSKFLKLFFKNKDDMYFLKNIMGKGPLYIKNLGTYGFQVWEAEISPIRKMLSVIDLEYTQWFTMTSFKEAIDDPNLEKESLEKKLPNLETEDLPPEKISTCKHEYVCDYRDIKPISTSESQSWIVTPTMLAIDIETYSPNHKAMPDPVATGHDVYMISCIFYKLYDQTSIKTYGLLYGDCNDIPNSTIIKSNSEVELIRSLEKLILETDPDIVTGYNHMGYDFMYLDSRLKKKLEEWEISGRLKGVKSKMTKEGFTSSAYSKNVFYNLEMPGRINIDLLPLVRNGSEKLDMYKLDFVSKHYLGKTKNDVKPDEMFRIYEFCKKSKHADPITKEKALQDMTRVMEYCIQDSYLVIELFRKLEIWIDLCQRSSILGVTLVEIFTKGQQMKCLSQIYNECFKNDIVIDHREKDKLDYEGGYVAKPIQGVHENIICLDFASMYPSIIQADNISYETLVCPEYYDKIPDEICTCFDIESKELVDDDEDEEGDNDAEGDDEGVNKTNKKEILKFKHYRFKFVKKEVKEGIIPKIVRKLVTERNQVKKLQSTVSKDEDPFLWNTLEKRQLTLKVAGNSVYGFLGAYKLPLMQGAMAVTWRGRNQINSVNEYLLKNFPEARIIYNDTDSVMVDLNIIDRKKCVEIGIQLAKDITKLFPDPVKIEFEKGMFIIIFTKKRYAYLKIGKDGDYVKKLGKDKKVIIGKDGNPELLITKIGIITKRSEYCKWTKDMYESCLESILYKKDHLCFLNLYFESIKNLINGKVQPQDLVTIRKLGANYKSETAYMRIFSDELRRIGKPVSAGDRLQYLIIDNGEEALGKKLVLLEDYTNQKIDVLYYLEHSIMKPLEQLFEIGHALSFKNINHIFYKPIGKNRKPICVNKIVKVLYQLLVDHSTKSIDEIIDLFYENLNRKKVTFKVRNLL